MLMMTSSSHPKTFFSMKLAARVGEVVMTRLKRQFNRPRPRNMPALYPTGRPGHASIRPVAHRESDGKGPDRDNDTNVQDFALRKISDQIGRRNRFQQGHRGTSLQERYHGGSRGRRADPYVSQGHPSPQSADGTRFRLRVHRQRSKRRVVVTGRILQKIVVGACDDCLESSSRPCAGSGGTSE